MRETASRRCRPTVRLRPVGHIDISRLGHRLPDGRMLLEEVSFRVGDGAKVALVGANGSGKTTLLSLITGDLDPQEGAVTRSGGLGVMRQFVGHRPGDVAESELEELDPAQRPGATVRDLLVAVSPPRVCAAGRELDLAELLMMEQDDTKTQMRYAQALSDWADAGGYEAEVLWDVCTQAALGMPYERAQWRELTTLSGGEQKRLVLEALLRGPDEVLLLDEPDNYLDVPGKRWLEEQITGSAKTILLRLARPRAAGPHRDPDRDGRGRLGLGARRWVRVLPPGTRRPARTARRVASSLGRTAGAAAQAGALLQEQGRLQLGHGQPLPRRGEATRTLRCGGPAGGAAARARRAACG